MKLTELPTRDTQGHLHVVIESPRGSRVKLAYQPNEGVFKLSRPLVLGVAYPYDWGFVPSTLAPDGDPVDAMVYHELPTYPGVLISCRPIGVVKITQKEGGGPRRENDRLIVVPAHDERYTDVRSLHENVRAELEQFFLLATLRTAKKVHIVGWKGPNAALKLVEQGETAYRSAER